MKVGIFDTETTALTADNGILLCTVIKHYDSGKPLTIIRADNYPSWKNNRTNNRAVVRDTIDALGEYDILVAHNGKRFDRSMLVTWSAKNHFPVTLSDMKIIDPVLIARQKLRLHRNSLESLIAFFDISEQKTRVKFHHWMKAAYEGSKTSMNYIVNHCVCDVNALVELYDELRPLVRDVNSKGSFF